jgi:hypothetical protein
MWRKSSFYLLSRSTIVAGLGASCDALCENAIGNYDLDINPSDLSPRSSSFFPSGTAY